MSDSKKILGLIGILVLLAVVGPLFSIVALNHLFHIGIELSFDSWLAMAWVHLVLGGGALSSKNKSS